MDKGAKIEQNENARNVKGRNVKKKNEQIFQHAKILPNEKGKNSKLN